MKKKILVTEGMVFYDKAGEPKFRVEKYDFYDDGNPILCGMTERLIYPLDEIIIGDYRPKGIGFEEEADFSY